MSTKDETLEIYLSGTVNYYQTLVNRVRTDYKIEHPHFQRLELHVKKFTKSLCIFGVLCFDHLAGCVKDCSMCGICKKTTTEITRIVLRVRVIRWNFIEILTDLQRSDLYCTLNE